MVIKIDKGMTVIINTGKDPCLTILNGYKAETSEEIHAALDAIHASVEYTRLQEAGFTRTRKSQFNEWKAHNLLYRLDLRRDQTGHVYINENEPKWRRAIYALLSIF